MWGRETVRFGLIVSVAETGAWGSTVHTRRLIRPRPVRGGCHDLTLSSQGYPCAKPHLEFRS